MTPELRELLIQVRSRLEAPGEDEDSYLGINQESDRLQRLWDPINALVGDDPEIDCHEQDLQTDGKLLVFPTRA
jgi:hypothetical protein